MPLYECLTVAGTLDNDQRQRLAQGLTRTHVEHTGAPPELVQVTFPELPAGRAFTAGEPSQPAIIRGSIRAGRPPEVRRALIQGAYDLYRQVTGAAPMAVLVAVIDVPASWAMEGGQLLPEPERAAEQAWLNAVAGTTPTPTPTPSS